MPVASMRLRSASRLAMMRCASFVQLMQEAEHQQQQLLSSVLCVWLPSESNLAC